VTLRRRRTWAATAIGSAILATVTLLAVQGCSADPPADAATSPRHVVTFAMAEQVYAAYLKASDEAAATGNETQALDLASAAQWAQLKGQYTALATAGTPVPRYRYGTPVFYIPALAGYPEWFVAAVPRQTVTGGRPGDRPGGRPSDRQGAPVNTLLLFTRLSATDTRTGATVPWTLSGSAVLAGALPAIARNSEGYAIDVTTTDPTLLLRPDVVGATQAALVDQGPASPAVAVISDGPQTTGLYRAQAAVAATQQARGLRYEWLLQGAAFPEFEFRLVGGGALVLYGMYLNTTNEHLNLVPGSPIPVPAAFTPLLAAPTEVGYHAVYANWTYQFAAVDPPATKHGAKVTIIASQSVPSYGHAY
jgi:hypothetical protein